MSRDCPNPPPEDPNKPPAQTYVPEELADSDLFDQGTSAGVNFKAYGNIPVEVHYHLLGFVLRKIYKLMFVSELWRKCPSCRRQI